MKTKIYSYQVSKLIMLASFTIFACNILNAQNTFPATGAAGIGTTSPNASSLLEIKSTSKGFLAPRMTLAQRNAIGAPATGLLIYQTNSTPGFYYYGGSAWKAVTPAASGWSLTGNAGTNPSTNFLGTTDAQPLVFKVNNVKAGYIDNTTNGNVGFGYQGLGSNTTGTYNTATGYQSLNTNTDGGSNTAVGYQSLYSNDAYNNTAIGTYAMYTNYNGRANTAIGSSSLVRNTSGNGNTATGYSALSANTTGSSNTANGESSLLGNTSGSYNTALGSYAVSGNNSGSYNTGNGYLACSGRGSNNTGTGALALSSQGVGNGDNNTANGVSALANNGNGATQSYEATANTAIGYGSLTTNTTGYNNTASGGYTLENNTTGYNNAAFGLQALQSNVNGVNNTALGVATDVNTGGLFNTTTIGVSALATASNQVRIGSIGGTYGTDPTSIGGKVGWSTLSDGRVKKNIKENVPGLAFINKLKPITYNIDNDAIGKAIQHPTIKDKDGKTTQPSADEMTARKAEEQIVHTGFIAQDVEKAAKSLNYDFSGVDAAKNDKDLYGLRYAEFVVPLVKAVQELSKMNDDKDTKIDNLQKQIDDLKAMMVAGNTDLKTSTAVTLNDASLDQNNPNPFSNSTTISYTLPQTVNSAQIIITDKSGRTLKTVNVSGSGKGSLNVDAATLAAGAYNYSLIINGKLIGTKQMILAK